MQCKQAAVMYKLADFFPTSFEWIQIEETMLFGWQLNH